MTNVTSSLREAIRDRHPPPEWQVAFEVQFPRDEGGLRFADSIAIDTRKGIGFNVHGFEIKVSRSDWLTERADPTKSAPARALCDFWWIVQGSDDLVHPEEAKAISAGLLTMTPKGLAVTLHAPRLNMEKNRPLDRALVGAFLRRLDPMEPRTYWDMKVRRAEERGFAKGRSEQGRMTRARLRRGEPSDEEWPTP